MRTKQTTGKSRMAATKSAIVGHNPTGPEIKVKPQWEKHYRALLKLRDRLLSDLGTHRREAGETIEPHSIHLADTGTDEFDRDLALSHATSNQEALYEVDEAIRRIQEGTYGVCEVTGKPIARERLRAVPWTRFSREAEAQFEAGSETQKRSALGKLQSIGELDAEAPEDSQEPE